MKVGIHLALWTARPSADEHAPILRDLKRWGYDGVELHIAALSLAQTRALAAIASDLGLARTANLVMRADRADPASPDPKLRRAALDAVRWAVDKAAALGSGILVGPMFQGLGRFTGSPPTERERRWAADVIRDAADHAAPAGIRLALEPLNRFEMYLVNTLADGRRFCQLVDRPNVGLLADTHHAHIEETDPPAAFAAAAAAGRLFHVHISENHRGLPGAGHAAPLDIFRALRRADYDGWLTVEAFTQKVPDLARRLHIWRPLFEGDEHDLARRALRYIHEMWRCAGTDPWPSPNETSEQPD